MLSHSFGFTSVVLLGYLCLSLRTNYTGHERENTPERESGPVATLTQKRSKCHWQTRRFLSHESDGRFCDGTWGRLSQRPPKMHRSANAVGRRAFRWEFTPPLHNGSSDGKKKIMKHKETIFLLFHAHNMFISNFASTVAQMLTGKMCRVKLVRTAWLNPRALLSLVGLLSHFVFPHLLFMRTPLWEDEERNVLSFQARKASAF